MPENFSFTRYLVAKKTVDDRALNGRVWKSLALALPLAAPGAPLRVLDIGAGVGTMLERMLEWDLLTHTEYTAIDAEVQNIAFAHDRLSEWAKNHSFQVTATPSGQVLKGKDRLVQVTLEPADLSDFASRERNRRQWDLLVANAFLDLVDVFSTLPVLFDLLKENALFYFTINFDRATILEPAIDPVFDQQIVELYHETMDKRLVKGVTSGDSRTGRHLFTHLKKAGGQILDAGSSDWVVYPGPQGYPADEAYFLHFIIHTIHQALESHPGLDADRFNAWVAERHAQIVRGELVYIAHQLDFLGQVCP